MSAYTDGLKEHYTELKLLDTTTQQHEVARIQEIEQRLTALGVTPAVDGFPTGTILSDAQTGTGNSTNTWDYGDMGQFGNNERTKPLLVRVVTTIGLTPTCTYAIEGSTDNTTFAALEFADLSDPLTFGTSTFILTTETTVVKLVKPGQKFRYLRTVYSLNTNVTNTVDVFELG